MGHFSYNLHAVNYPLKLTFPLVLSVLHETMKTEK